MIKSKYIERVISALEYLLFIANVLIAFRLIVLYIDINSFIDERTGRISMLGKNVKFFQMVVDHLTSPIVNPFKSLLANLMGIPNSGGLVDVLSPAFVIFVLLMLIAALKVAAPLLVKYIQKFENKD